jgi:dolichol-phosphate mannosyltransferase
MIIAALPAYNEAEALPRLLQRMKDTQPLLPDRLRVVVVDDGSKDDTAAAAERCNSDEMQVEVVRHDRNRGLHGALDTAFRAAIERAQDDDWIVVMDADDTHPPDLMVPMLAKAAAENATVVIASRFQPGAEWFGLSWDRVLFSKGVSWMFRIAWPMRGVRDYTCGYRLYRAGLLRAAYQQWGDRFVNEPSFACMPDVLWKVSRLSPRFAEIPLSLHYDRKPGESKMNVGRTIRRTLGLIAKRRLGINS